MRDKSTPEPKSDRYVAWKNMLVAAINAGLDQKIFHLEVDPPPPDRRIYRFEFDSVVPGIAYVNDAGWDEITVHVALWPTKDAERWISCGNVGFICGEAVATGWLERREGRWLQTSETRWFRCRRNRLASVAAMTKTPVGYMDHGKFFC